METALAANDPKKGDSWKSMSSWDLVKRLEDEMQELTGARCEAGELREAALEAIDVANLAMMVHYACHRELGHEMSTPDDDRPESEKATGDANV